MRVTILTILGLSACFSAAVADDCFTKNGLKDELSVASGHLLDASYFTDASELTPPSNGLNEEVDPDRLVPGKQAFCSRSEYDIANALTSDKQQKMSFVNPTYGFNSKLLNDIFGVGLCRWHTRFQRSAAYLANYFPFKPKPSHDEALKIIDQIIAERSVVEIPGYPDLASFTADYQKEIKSALNGWKVRDYVEGSAAFDRLLDTSSEKPGELRGRMDALYDQILNKPQLVVLRIHSQGDSPLETHALLLTKLEPLRDQASAGNPWSALNLIGYRMTVIDSNYPTQTIQVDYKYGESSVRYCEPGQNTCKQMIPREAYTGDLPKLDDAVKAYCTPDPKTARR